VPGGLGKGVPKEIYRCFVLFCFVLFCFVLFCFVLFCFVLFCFCFSKREEGGKGGREGKGKTRETIGHKMIDTLSILIDSSSPGSKSREIGIDIERTRPLLIKGIRVGSRLNPGDSDR